MKRLLLNIYRIFHKEKPVVKLVDSKEAPCLMFWCPFCKCPHTIAVRPPGRKIPISNNLSNFSIFKWNGSTIRPTIEDGCIAVDDCHSCVKDGRICEIGRSNFKKMLPVSKWPLRRPK